MNFQAFIGYDAREKLAWEVCVASMQHHAADYPVHIRPIGREQLEEAGLYTRGTEIHEQYDTGDNLRFDLISGEYCSTDFSLARFWVPIVAGASGWALFCDCDFLWRADVWRLLDLADPRFAVMVVPNRYEPPEDEKMDGQVQTRYWRKNWSSLMLWNLAHAGARRLSLFDLNTWHKHDLHGFRWLADGEIGFLPPEWNYLVRRGARGERRGAEIKAVHFTEGTPDMAGYGDQPFADEWRAYASNLMPVAGRI